jgi:hypothetical protein
MKNSAVWTRLAVSAIPLIGGTVAAAIVVSARSELPDRVATHFLLSGRPDSSVNRDVFCWLTLGALVLAGTFCALATLRVGGRSVVASQAALSTFGVAIVAIVSVWMVRSQRNLSSWMDARGPSVPLLIAMFGAGAIAGAVVARLARALPALDDVPTPAGSVGLAASERATWTRTLTSPWPLVGPLLGTAIALSGIFRGVPSGVAVGLGLILLGIEMRQIRVTVGPIGLRVAWGPLGFPRTTIPLRNVTSASSIDVRPMEWGGWGYRGSLRLFGRAAAVLRKGPGIRVDLVGGKSFAVTIDDASTGAGLLNDLADRQSKPR